jgi:hypothetical protein
MIIEAGYDILTLLTPKVLKNAASKRALWALTMDAELHFLGIRKVSATMTKPIDGYVKEIRRTLTAEFLPVGHYVLAYTIPDVHVHREGWLDDVETSLSLASDLVNHRLLGLVLFDPKDYYSSVPRYRFRDYPLLGELPRSASFPGPHPFDCACPACEQHDRKLRENGKRLHSNSA